MKYKKPLELQAAFLLVQLIMITSHILNTPRAASQNFSP